MAYSNPIVAGDTLVRDAIKSENYVAGVSGWAIFRDGNAEFNDIIARGDITARSLSVPFVNQQGGTYHINIIEQNVDKPNIEFQYDGVVHPVWSDGNISIEAFDLANAFAEITMQPLNPAVANIGNPPILRMQSNRADLTTPGLVDFLGSNSDSGAHPVFRVAPQFVIEMESLRTQFNELPADAARTVVNDITFGADFDCSVTVPRPPSNRLTVALWMEPRTTAGTGGGLMSFEVMDTNAAGTVRVASSDGRAAYSIQGETGFHSASGQFTVDAAGSSVDLFIRLTFRCTNNATTVNFARARLEVTPNP